MHLRYVNLYLPLLSPSSPDSKGRKQNANFCITLTSSFTEPWYHWHSVTQIAVSHLHRCIFNETKYAAIQYCLSLSEEERANFWKVNDLFGT